MEGKRPPRPVHPTFTEDLWTLIQRCWDPEPDSRPETSEVLNVLSKLVPVYSDDHTPIKSATPSCSESLTQKQSTSGQCYASPDLRLVLSSSVSDQELLPLQPQQELPQEPERDAQESDPQIDGMFPPTRKISSGQIQSDFAGGFQDGQEQDAEDVPGQTPGEHTN